MRKTLSPIRALGQIHQDDRDAAILEDHSNDPVVEELTSFINSLSNLGSGHNDLLPGS